MTERSYNWLWACLVLSILLLVGGGIYQIRQLERAVALTQRADELFHHISLGTVAVLGQSMNTRDLERSLAPLHQEVEAFVHFYRDAAFDDAVSQGGDIVNILTRYMNDLMAFGLQHERARRLGDVYRQQLTGRLPQGEGAYDDALNPHLLSTLQGDSADKLLPLYLQWQEVDGLMHRMRDRLAAGEELSTLLGWKMDQSSEINRLKGALYGTTALMVLLTAITIGGMLWHRDRHLRAMADHAQGLAKSRSDFLANMSHEIRTPMNAVIGFTSLALQTELTLTQRDYLGKIKVASDNLLLLINDILDLSKVESGNLTLEECDFSIDELLDSLAAMFADMSERKALEVMIDKAPSVPERLRGDALRLGQVLINLVGNAIKFTEEGMVTLSIRVDEQGRLAFSVSDTGIGIDPDKRSRLFKPFSQLDAGYSRKYGGTGLGLNISQRLVGLMGGTIGVESEPGQGARFFFDIPFSPAIYGGAHTERLLPGGSEILLLEDNPLVMDLLRSVLQRAGAVVHEATTLADARESVRMIGDRLTMVILDWRLGDEDGLDLVPVLRGQPRLATLPVLVISAWSRDGLHQRMESLELQHFLSKPVTEPLLLDKMNALLTQREQERVPSPDERTDWVGELAGIRILLAEDNRVNQQLIVEYLRRVEAHTEVVDNGAEAVQWVLQEEFDLVLMDLQMPVMDGLEATRRIRRYRSSESLPIIALTASAMPEDRGHCFDAGMNGYVTKPVGKTELYKAIIELVTARDRQAVIPSQSLPLFDCAMALSRVGGDEEALMVMASQFVSEHRHAMYQIELALQQEERAHLCSLLGSLKRLAGNLMAKRLQRACSECIHSVQSGASPRFEELHSIFAQTLAALERYLLSHESTELHEHQDSSPWVVGLGKE
ncbi:response regulator [Aeromonas sp. R6-2]|uniref:hybrid sensor histidine kinase/response regulator n=1 Tax=unclassified Aeromonas TaxID=257493 RepID=UPI0034A3F7E9